jgi:hypothetical protein
VGANRSAWTDDVTVNTKKGDRRRTLEGGRQSPLPSNRSAWATLDAPGLALGQVVRDLDTCPGPVRQFSQTHPQAHVGR